ncbi:hypothetical protein O181_069520 [Austropuccinia psidii MF-1]|uniref:Uncharacterized protein n=1 Tax=Austropuccinia psidii MF-1 TaxID=1389203 RepID=A0A9Q3F344_9BASI|nr:hypothetical protein [Austropuccinia psidii MF-1]
MLLQHPQDVTPMLPPISTLTTPYASSPPPLKILMLLQCPHDMPLTPPPHICTQPSLRLHTTASSSPELTILMLPY